MKYVQSKRKFLNISDIFINLSIQSFRRKFWEDLFWEEGSVKKEDHMHTQGLGG